jgi:hypothetical protein
MMEYWVYLYSIYGVDRFLTHYSTFPTFHHSMWRRKDGALKNYLISGNCRDIKLLRLGGTHGL